MDLVVSVAIGVLFIVFTGALTALIFVLWHRRCQKAASDWADQKPILNNWLDGSSNHVDCQPKKNVAEDSSGVGSAMELELEDIVQLSPNIEKLIKDNQWIFDDGGLVGQCLAILKLCHTICDNISNALMLQPFNGIIDQETVDDIRLATRRVLPLVDSLVDSMYKVGRNAEIHVALLEARAAALVLAINNLAFVFRATRRRFASTIGAGDDVDDGASSSNNVSSIYRKMPLWLYETLADLEVKFSELKLLAQSIPVGSRNVCAANDEDFDDQEIQINISEKVGDELCAGAAETV